MTTSKKIKAYFTADRITVIFPIVTLLWMVFNIYRDTEQNKEDLKALKQMYEQDRQNEMEQLSQENENMKMIIFSDSVMAAAAREPKTRSFKTKIVTKLIK